VRGLLVRNQGVQVVQVEITNCCRKPNDESKDRTKGELFVSESLKRSLKSGKGILSIRFQFVNSKPLQPLVQQFCDLQLTIILTDYIHK
jgi:hypothetical protein